MESQLVWAPDATEGYVMGRVIDIGPGNVATVLLELNHSKPGTKQQKIECSIENVYPTEINLKKNYDDNCSLMYLNEGNLLHNIRLRYFDNKIYTYVANILIALNPYCNLKDKLYNSQVLQSYQGKSLGKMPPHVFAIADKAYHDMKRMSHSQSIIVSGESGAGKTESTKYILRYVCESFGGTQSGNATQIEKLILEANPILEAFGNAKTARNNNSSRFGKFIEIYMSSKTLTVAGGHIAHYLLEKSRICGQSSPLERNYHIFYQLCVGLSNELFTKLRLGPPDKFAYLNKGCTRYFLTTQENQQLNSVRKSAQHLNEGHLTDSIVNDLCEFNAMDKALEHFGVSKEQKFTIYQIVAAILHLGNISFEESPNDSHGGCRVTEDQLSQEALQNAAQLLGVDCDQLQQCLQTRIMQTNKGGYKGSTYMVPLKVHEAQSARDALAKAIYSRLFDYIVSKIINQSLPLTQTNGVTASSVHSIGVLDIAGFEYFQTNSFEQFCINYCNEKLQNFFNDRILNDEQLLYENEGLGIRRVDYVDNRDCIELFEAKSSGIFDLLDEESRLPKPSAQHFTEAVHSINRGKFRLEVPRKSKLRVHRELRDDEGFVVRHFAGAVCYQTSQFIEKNNDALHTNLAFLMLESGNKLLKSFFDTPSLASSTSLADKSVRLSADSVSSKFRKQLTDLINKLESTGTHFVRCVKPNLNMVPQLFDGGCILSQLKCSGMNSVLQLMQYGYPSRATYAQIYDLYAPRLPARLARLEPRFFCRALIKSVGLGDSDVRFGVTKVFFRPGRFAEFDMLLKNDDPKALDELVQRVLHWLVASRWRRAQWCALSTIKLKNKILFRRQCIIAIQKNVRMYLAKKRYQPHYQSMRKIKLVKEHLQKIRPLLEKIQSDGERKNFSQQLATLEQTILIMGQTMVVPNSNPAILDKVKVDRAVGEIRAKIDTMVANLTNAITEQELRLKRLQETLENERRKQVEEEAKLREQEEMKRKKAQMEERKRAEVEQQRQMIAQMTQTDFGSEPESLQYSSLNGFLNEEERQRQIEYLKRLEQERRDYELALRLSQDGSASVSQAVREEIQCSYANASPKLIDFGEVTPIAPKIVATNGSNKKQNLECWNYAQLRDTINTSNDIELLEACREEFHRRLKVYHQWKYRMNMHRSSRQSNLSGDNQEGLIIRAPDSVMETYYNPDSAEQNQLYTQLGLLPSNSQQRYFRLPFGRSGGPSKGLWYAHFDGKWIARQMEIHPEREPILLIAGRDDLKMCELSLDETGLAKKRGVEILAEEFEAEWNHNGGQPYIKSHSIKR